MKEQLEQIKKNALASLDAAASPATLEELRVRLLGKKGELTAVLKQMGKLSPEERPVMGQLANSARLPSTPPLWRPSWLPRPLMSPFPARAWP